MTLYYYNPDAPVGGNGQAINTAFQTPVSMPNTAGHTHLFRMDGVIHRPLTFPTYAGYRDGSSSSTGTTPDGDSVLAGIANPPFNANMVRDLSTNANSTTFSAYGTGTKVTLSGAVLWTGTVGAQTVNGLACKVLERGVVNNFAWFPRVDGKATYPSIAAPTADDGVDQFIATPQRFDDVAPGVPGFRYVPSNRAGGTTDPTKEVSWIDRQPTEPTNWWRYRVKIKAPGFLARANAVAPLAGYTLMMRTGSNFTNYFCPIESYDPVDGSIFVGSQEAPNNTTTGLFFYALVAHPYGIRQNYQYALNTAKTGWLFTGPSGVIDVACWSMFSRFMALGLNQLDPAIEWVCEAFAHGNKGPRGGHAFYLEGGEGVTWKGKATMKQVRNFGRDGAFFGAGGAGRTGDIEINAQELIECVGIKLHNFAPGTVDSGNIVINGPGYSDEGGGSMRVAGAGSNFVCRDQVVTCRASVHDNGNNWYQEFVNLEYDGIVISGHTNPGADQWNPTKGTVFDNVNRRLKNAYLTGRPNTTLTDYDNNSTWRHDNGNRDGLWDRALILGGKSNPFGNASGVKGSEGMVVRRTIIERFYTNNTTDPQAMAGVTFENCVMLLRSGSIPTGQPSILGHLVDSGGTLGAGNAEFTASRYLGTLTDDMWRVLTRNDADTGYEEIEYLAPQLGLILPAYGTTRLLRRPAFVHCPFYVGHPTGLMLGEFINPNPLAVMTLPAGLGDNDKLYPLSAFNGFFVIPNMSIPDQPEYELVLRVTDAGASNGPSQDFTYTVTLNAPGEAETGDPDPPPVDPPPPVLPRGHKFRMKLKF